MVDEIGEGGGILRDELGRTQLIDIEAGTDQAEAGANSDNAAAAPANDAAGARANDAIGVDDITGAPANEAIGDKSLGAIDQPIGTEIAAGVANGVAAG